LTQAVDIWRRYQAADLAGAVEEFEASQLQQIVREKIDSPLAAAVATLVLLRGGLNYMGHTFQQTIS
jgi:hypothetical protein